MKTFQGSKVVQKALNAALELIQSRFGDGVDGDRKLAFHGVAHTCGVVNRAVRLAQAMGLGEKETDLCGIGAAFHDVAQDWVENRRESDGAILRKRFAVRNEQASADEGVAWMREQGGYEERDFQLVTDGILATVPGWDGAKGTVFQPNLRPDSHPVVRAIALADLATAGMDGKAFVEEGDPLFREENLDVARAIRAAARLSDIPTDVQQSYRARMLAWCNSQTGFARGRQASLEGELGNLDASVRERVRELFLRFPEAIEANASLAVHRGTLSFWKIAADMGYLIPSA